MGAALTAMTAPAMAAWHGYISHPLGFAFAAPGELKVEKGTYRGAVAGTHDTIVYRFSDDDIEYKVVVIDMTGTRRKRRDAAGRGRIPFPARQESADGHVWPLDRQFGRKITVDLPNNGGRTTAAFFFINGRIISLQATVLPANGDYETPQMGRFVDSLTFFPVRAADDAIELPPPQ